MAKIIYIGGNKGGSGKTSVAHLLCTGLALLNRTAALVTTDNRPLRSSQGRPYNILDGREGKALAALIEAATRSKDDAYLVIDGGATRHGEFDKTISKYAALFLIPFTACIEDMELASAYCLEHPHSFVVPNRWTTNSMAAKADKVLLDQMEEALPGRVMPPVPDTRGSGMLLENEIIAKDINTRTRNVARALAINVLEKLLPAG